jgi:hypothetical protein
MLSNGSRIAAVRKQMMDRDRTIHFSGTAAGRETLEDAISSESGFTCSG